MRAFCYIILLPLFSVSCLAVEESREEALRAAIDAVCEEEGFTCDSEDFKECRTTLENTPFVGTVLKRDGNRTTGIAIFPPLERRR
jgi:hypothetical protein